MSISVQKRKYTRIRGRTSKESIKMQNDAVKYQIFISSTFKDLSEERQAVSHAVLELNHIPAGMELFPAFDQSQLDFIKRVIDDCDYYVIILGGRYGSLTEEGISFTEAEYDYAVQKEKPVIALIHGNVNDIPHGKVEESPEFMQKLKAFKSRLEEGRLVKHWSTKDELKSHAITSLVASFDQMPQTGWRRNDGTGNESLFKRIEELYRELELNRERLTLAKRKLKSYEELADAEIDLKFSIGDEPFLFPVSAETLIREFAAPLKNGFTRDDVEERIKSYLRHSGYEGVDIVPQETIETITLFFEVFEVAQEHSSGLFTIHENHNHLLKAAFMKKKTPKTDIDDEIPF